MLKAKKLLGMIAGLLALGLICLAAARAGDVVSAQSGPVRRIIAFKGCKNGIDFAAVLQQQLDHFGILVVVRVTDGIARRVLAAFAAAR